MTTSEPERIGSNPSKTLIRTFENDLQPDHTGRFHSLVKIGIRINEALLGCDYSAIFQMLYRNRDRWYDQD